METEGAISGSRNKIQQLTAQYELRFESARQTIHLDVQKRLSEVTGDMDARNLGRFLRNFPTQLASLEAQLDAEEEDLLNQIRFSTYWNWLFPAQSDLQKSAIRLWFRSARKIVIAEKQKFEHMSILPTTDLRFGVESSFSNYVFGLKSLDDSLVVLERQFKEAQLIANELRNDATRRVEEERNRLKLQLREDVFKIYSALVDTFSSWKPRLERCLADLRQEAEPLGITLPS